MEHEMTIRRGRVKNACRVLSREAPLESSLSTSLDIIQPEPVRSYVCIHMCVTETMGLCVCVCVCVCVSTCVSLRRWDCVCVCVFCRIPRCVGVLCVCVKLLICWCVCA